MTKKVLALLLACCTVFSLVFCSCSGGEKKFKILEEDFGAELYGIGFRNGDIALGNEVQKHLDDMIADGKMAEISKKWFGADIVLKDADYVEEHEASADDESLQKIKDKGYFIVGLDDSFPPMGYRDENNEIVGFDIDLAKEVAKRMGVEVRFQPIDWNSKELELDGGKIDMIWNGMTITDERVAAMYFAKPYLANTQVVIVPVDSPIQTKADLAGKKISIQEGSSAVDAVTADDIYEQIGELVYFGNNQEAYSDLKIGRVDAFVVDRVAGSYILKTDGTLAE